MTRERDRWRARYDGARMHPTHFVMITRLDRDWERFVEIPLTPEEAKELQEALERWRNDRTE